MGGRATAGGAAMSARRDRYAAPGATVMPPPGATVMPHPARPLCRHPGAGGPYGIGYRPFKVLSRHLLL